MARTFSKRIVVDASVARAAGGPPDSPVPPESPASNPSGACRQAMTAMVEIGHRLVWTGEISREWRKHAYWFSRTWRTTMFQKDLVVALDTPTDVDLEEAIDEAAEFEGRCVEMQKDRHLLVAALHTDRRVISLNETDRKRFARICDQVTRIQAIIWVNPAQRDEDCRRWLHEGAKPEAHRRLNNYD